ncbi:MAG: hypothetical protein WCG27_07055, partial [Pseudomonadota bacterium]
AIECAPGQYQVREHSRTEYYRKDGTYVSEAKVKTYCKEYQNFKPLKLKFEEKMPRGWPHKKEKFKKWSELEKKKVTAIINNLPKALNQVGELKILRADKSETPNNPASSAPEKNIIVIYDSIKDYDLQRVLAHELAHLLYLSLPGDTINAYSESADWKRDGKGNYTTTRTNFTEEDGSTGPEEDFANSVEHILFNKDVQKVLKKEIFNCLKKILENIK